jgi:hypothetical protein
MLETGLKHTLVLIMKQHNPVSLNTGLRSHWSPAFVGKASEAGPCMLSWVRRPCWQALLGENKGLLLYYLLYFLINRHRYQYKCAIHPIWVQRPWQASLGEKTKACCCITIYRHRGRHLHQQVGVLWLFALLVLQEGHIGSTPAPTEKRRDLRCRGENCRHATWWALLHMC